MLDGGGRLDEVPIQQLVLHGGDDGVVCVLVDQTRFELDVANPIDMLA